VELDTPRAAASPTAEIAPTATQEASDDQKSNPDEANCTVVSRQPTPGPTEQSLVPLVSDTDWTHGPEDPWFHSSAIPIGPTVRRTPR